MEDVVTWKLLASRHHFLSTDDAHIVHCFQLFYSGIWITGGGGGGGGEREREREKGGDTNLSL